MPHRESKAIGERGKTTYNMKCAICRNNVTISGYVLRDYDGYPLNRSGKRFDYMFPDGTSNEGILCNTCNDNHRNKVPLIRGKDGQWNWNLKSI